MSAWLVRIGIVIAALVVITGAGLGIGALWLRGSLPTGDGIVRVSGPSAHIEVFRDHNGVPHIFAENVEDSAFALGYVHAQDRLWQMETMRRFGAGRLSEVFGDATLQTDRYMRTLGLYRLAEQESGNLSDDWQRTLETYAAGVNAWLARRSGPLPPEFLVLGFEPKTWRIADTLVWGRLMAWRLTRNRREELLRARLADRLTPAQIKELWPTRDGEDPITAGEHAATGLGGLARSLIDVDPVPMGYPRGASNVWVVGGERTISGKPLLANDPHLSLSVPGTWYLARIVTPALSFTGATAPGTPLVFLGHNGHIAWGNTSGDADLEDLFEERTDPSDPARYLSPNGPLPFETREEVIAIKDREPMRFRVRATRHGPIVSDALPTRLLDESGSDRKLLALSAPYLRTDDRTSEAVFRMQMARDWDAFRTALSGFEYTQLNVFYADTSGAIGFVAPGRVPVRRSGRGQYPTAGWTGDTDWTETVPFDALPHAHNPTAALLVNANNRNVPLSSPWFFGDDWDAGYRARRILDLLEEHPRQTPDTMTAIQMDTVSLAARDLTRRLLRSLPDDGRHSDVTNLLRSWNGDMRRERPEPLIFAAWVRAFGKAIYADELGDAFESYWGERPEFLKFVLDEGHGWCDDIATDDTETCARRVAASLDTAIADLSGRYGPDPAAWRWGNAHRLVMRHPLFDRIPVVRHFANIEIETDGGSHTINRGAMRLSDGDAPFAHVHGAGYRAVYDLADLSVSRFILVPGQSGHPLSPHYDDMVERWRQGDWIELGQDRDTLRRHHSSRLVFEPAPPRLSQRKRDQSTEPIPM